MFPIDVFSLVTSESQCLIKFSFALEASEILKDMGLVLPFDSLAEMVESPASGEEDPCLSEIFHKYFIEVNEERTEASTVTVSTHGYGRGYMEEPIDFVADHPFLFLIREVMTGTVLFTGIHEDHPPAQLNNSSTLCRELGELVSIETQIFELTFDHCIVKTLPFAFSLLTLLLSCSLTLNFVEGSSADPW